MWKFLLEWTGVRGADQYNFISGIFADVTIFSAGLGAFLHTRCHKKGCYRGAKYPHGHYKLCHVHHPKVPSHGKIEQEHLDAIDSGA